jgi:hypothetical protein
MDIKPRHRSTCHCGAVELELTMENGIDNPRRCDCSMCRRRGTVICSTPLANLTVVKGAETLRLYQFHSRTAEHYFCSICGIHTHHRLRSDPSQYGVNLGCLEGVNPFQVGPVTVYDGVNHPADGGGETG